MKLKLTTNNILITGIALLLLSIATFIFFSIADSRRINNTAKLEEHTQEVLLRSEKILSLARDIEANARGYILTGQQSFLEPVEKTQKEINNHLTQLKALTGNNPVQQAAIDSLSFYIDKRIAYSNLTIAVRKLKGEEAAKAIVEMRKGKIFTDRLHLIIDKMQATENNLYAQRKEINDRNDVRLNSILMGVVIAIFIIFLLFILKIRDDFIARKKAESDLAKLNEELEKRVFERTNEVIQSKNALTETFERITDAFIALDKNWRYTYMNKKAGEIFQRIPEQMIGKHIWTEFPEGIKQPFYNACFQAMEMQHYIYLEEYYVPYGIWLENHIYPSPDGLSIFFRDITEKKKAEEALNNNRIFIESILNASPDIIYIYDIEERKNIYINEGIQINLGYSDDEIKQMGDQVLSTLMYPGDFDFYLHSTYPKYETLKDKEIIAHEYRMKDKNGNWHWLYSKESIFLRKPDGTPKQIFGITTDITEQKNAEEKLHKSEELLRLSSELANVAAWEYDVETNSMSRSDNHDKLYGIENQGKWERNTFIDATHPDDRDACNRIIDNSLAIGGPDLYKFDFRIIHPDKSIHWLNVIGKIIERNPEGFGKKIRGFITDITERKIAENAVIESEEKYRTFFENSMDGILITISNGKVLAANPAACSIFGMTEKEICVAGREGLADLTDPELPLLLEERSRTGKAKGELTFLRKDGSKFPCEIASSCFINAHGEERTIMILRDITERKIAEEKIQKSEELFAGAFHASPAGILITRIADGKIIDANESFLRIFEFSREEAIGYTSIELNMISPDARAKLIQQQIVSGGINDFDLLAKTKSGKPIHLLLSSKPLEINGEACHITTLIDITARKKAEDEIKESEEKYRELVENITDIICTHDLNGHILFVNSAAEKLLGYKFNPQERINIRDILSPDTKDQFNNYIANIKKEGHVQGLMKVQTYTGEIRIWEYNNTLITTGVDTPIVRGFTRDITEQKKAEHAIRASEEKYRSLVEQAADAIFIADAAGRFITVNASACKLSQYSQEELLQMTIYDFAMMEDIQREPFHFDELKQGKTVHTERILKAKDGLPIQVEITSKLLSDGRLLTFVRDISERKKTERELSESETRLRTILKTEPECIKLINIKGELEEMNPAGLAMIEADSFEQVQGKSIFSIINKPYRKAFEQLTQNVFKGKSGTLAFEITGLKGTHRWLETHAVPMKDTEGKIVALLSVTRDITENKKAENLLIESEKNYRSLVEHASDGILQVNEQGQITLVNTAICSMLGYSKEELLKMKIVDTYAETEKQLGRQRVNQVNETGSVSFERVMIKKNGTGVPVDVSIGKTGTGQGLAIIRDISERKKTEEETKQLTQQLLKAEEIAQFGFLDWNLITNEIVLSPQVNIIYGIPENVVDVAEFINKVAHPDDKQFINENLELAVKGIKEYDIDHRIVRADGTIIWVNARAELIRDSNGNPVRLLGTILDITQRKQIEEKVKTYNDQLRELSTHLQTIREEERKRIAREIHDELGQQLTAIKMDVAWIDKKIPEEPTPLKNKLKNIITLLDGSNLSIRRILSQLRPGVLDLNSLPDAIEWLGSQFTASTGIPVNFSIPETEIKLSEPVAICIFRVCQEAFTNITRYAHAKNVTVVLKVINENIMVSIEDDGKGFDAAFVQQKSFGILGMKERVYSLNGKFELISAKGQGTKIVVSLPYKNA